MSPSFSLAYQPDVHGSGSEHASNLIQCPASLHQLPDFDHVILGNFPDGRVLGDADGASRSRDGKRAGCREGRDAVAGTAMMFELEKRVGRAIEEAFLRQSIKPWGGMEFSGVNPPVYWVAIGSAAIVEMQRKVGDQRPSE